MNNIGESPSNGDTFSMIYPPPNVTGYMHIGHCLTATIQDVISRQRRNQGQKVIWIPGTDHAGIATQAIVEKVLMKEKGLTRHDVGKEEFLNEIWRWTSERRNKIKEDLMALGVSMNWDEEYFTLNEVCKFTMYTIIICVKFE